MANFYVTNADTRSICAIVYRLVFSIRIWKTSKWIFCIVTTVYIARYCVRCKSMKEDHFQPMGLRNRWTDSPEIWHVWLRPPWAYEWNLPSRAFFNFGSFNALMAYPEKRGFSLNAPKNVFRWWVCSFGVGLPRGSNLPFLPLKPFSMGRIRLFFCIGVNRKRPVCLMVAP